MPACMTARDLFEAIDVSAIVFRLVAIPNRDPDHLFAYPHWTSLGAPRVSEMAHPHGKDEEGGRVVAALLGTGVEDPEAPGEENRSEAISPRC